MAARRRRPSRNRGREYGIWSRNILLGTMNVITLQVVPKAQSVTVSRALTDWCTEYLGHQRCISEFGPPTVSITQWSQKFRSNRFHQPTVYQDYRGRTPLCIPRHIQIYMPRVFHYEPVMGHVREIPIRKLHISACCKPCGIDTDNFSVLAGVKASLNISFSTNSTVESLSSSLVIRMIVGQKSDMWRLNAVNFWIQGTFYGWILSIE